MTEQKFKSEMRRAETMRRMAEPERAEYWNGYIRGLRRAYHGDKFGTAEEHGKWLSAINSRIEFNKQRGQGYADGLAYCEISSKMGRSSKYNEPTKVLSIRVPVSKVEEVRQIVNKYLRGE